MTGKEIIENYLRENGFDGLAGDDCGCGLDDLCPCDAAIPTECVPARRVMCDGKAELDLDGEPDHECPGVPHELYRPAPIPPMPGTYLAELENLTKCTRELAAAIRAALPGFKKVEHLLKGRQG